MASTESELQKITVMPVAPCGQRHRMDECVTCTQMIIRFWALFGPSPLLTELQQVAE